LFFFLVFFGFLFLVRLWASGVSRQGDSKNTIKKKKIKKNLTLVLFWPLTHPPTTGVTDLFWAAPCPRAAQPVAATACKNPSMAHPLGGAASESVCGVQKGKKQKDRDHEG
jgi:hypothetical protein